MNIHHLNSIFLFLEIQLFDKVTRWNAFLKLYCPVICQLTKWESTTVLGKITKESFVYDHYELELWVTLLSDTPHLQYYDVQTLEYRYISKYLVGVALTRYMHPPFFRESISWIISPFKFWTATIFLHAHLQVVYYNCVKFHKTPISLLGGVALTRYTTPLFVKA